MVITKMINSKYKGTVIDDDYLSHEERAKMMSVSLDKESGFFVVVENKGSKVIESLIESIYCNNNILLLFRNQSVWKVS